MVTAKKQSKRLPYQLPARIRNAPVTKKFKITDITHGPASLIKYLYVLKDRRARLSLGIHGPARTRSEFIIFTLESFLYQNCDPRVFNLFKMLSNQNIFRLATKRLFDGQYANISRNNTHFRLLDLPFELRLEIYYYCMPRKRHVRIPPSDNGEPKFDCQVQSSIDIQWHKNNLLLVSKQISEECLNILYGENVFCVTVTYETHYLLQKINGRKSHPYFITRAITPENCNRICNLLVVALPLNLGRDIWYCRKWRAVPKNLNRLVILLLEWETSLHYHSNIVMSMVSQCAYCTCKVLASRTDVRVSDDVMASALPGEGIRIDIVRASDQPRVYCCKSMKTVDDTWDNFFRGKALFYMTGNY